MKELRQLYYSHNDTSTLSSMRDEALLTCNSVEMLLKLSAEKILGLKVWSDEQNILELGATSFDVVRLANYLEEELKRCYNSIHSFTK